MSLYNHSTEQEVKVQTAWARAEGPPCCFLFYRSLSTDTHQVLNVGSCARQWMWAASERQRGAGEPQPCWGGVVRNSHQNSGLFGVKSPSFRDLPQPRPALAG